ncbi:MAG: uroporphyrinogen-III C-methyltransferase, partial [Myxococcota bacterium]
QTFQPGTTMGDTVFTATIADDLRAHDRLARADLVLYDALIDDSLLNIAANAQRFYVGKRAGRHSMSQQTIQNLLVRYAREGKRVVRLKAGDPFVLGRGGEEALALEAAGVPYEVVPGLSSAVAGPAFAGIPLTHRKLASNFVMLSGHAASGYEPILHALPPQSATLVILMGFGRRHAIIDTLLESGWARTTPAAIVAGAGTSSQSLWFGDLDGLYATSFDPEGAPVTLVIGATVELANQIRGTAPIEDISASSIEMRTHP